MFIISKGSKRLASTNMLERARKIISKYRVFNIGNEFVLENSLEQICTFMQIIYFLSNCFTIKKTRNSIIHLRGLLKVQLSCNSSLSTHKSVKK